MKMNPIKGLMAAPFTPMKEDGSINPDMLDRYVDVLVEQNVMNVFVNGSTGEGPSLTLDERKTMAEKWISVGKGKLNNVVIHVGTTNLKETQDLARHAAANGADAIALLPPFYYKPSTVDSLVKYLAKVSEEVPNLPVFYYHIPEMTGVAFPMITFVEAAKEKIPNFAGLKFTCFHLDDLGLCCDKFGEDLTLLYGKDEQLLGALAMGAVGGVGSTYNYGGRIYWRMMEAFKKGDLRQAKIHQFQSQRYIHCMRRHGFSMGLHKAVMEKVSGIPLGPPRLPMLPCSEEKKNALFKDLESMGFFEFLK